MKRVKIGNINIDTTQYLFRIDKDIESMRQSQVRIISYLDLLQEKAELTTDELILNDIYTEMDMYYCVYCIIEQFGSNQMKLEVAMYYFNDAIAKGYLSGEYTSLEKRNASLNRCIEYIVYGVISNYAVDTVNVTRQGIKWWQENVINLNYYEQNGVKSDVYIQNVAIGETKEEFLEKFKKSCAVWSYVRCNTDELKNNKIAIVKLSKQRNAQQYLSNCNIQLDIVTQNNLIDAGLLRETGGANATEFVQALKLASQKKSRIGDPATIIGIVLSIITTCTSVAVSIIQAVKQSKGVNFQPQQLNPTAFTSADDWSSFDSDRDGNIDTKWLLLLAGIFVVGYYLS